MALQVTAPAIGPANANQAKGTKQDIGDKEVFLRLLVAQMEHQDPLNPSDPTQMSAQLAQFNMVEQQINANKWLEQIASMQGGGGSADSAASYLGKTVTVNQDSVDYNGTAQNFAIDLGGNSSSSYVVVSDASGAPVRTFDLGALPAGVHQLSWDGMTDVGTQAAAGSYFIDVIAADTQGVNIPAVVQRSGMVDAVRITAFGTQLMVGGTPVSIADVTEIRL